MFLFLVTFALLSHHHLHVFVEKAADLIYHLSHLFTDLISYFDFFPLVYCGRILESDCITSLSLFSLIFSLFI